MANQIPPSELYQQDRRRTRYAGRILLVSAAADRSGYADWLRQAGFCPLETDTAPHAYQIASTVLLSAVVTEVALRGGGDGLSLVRQLKQHSRLRLLPILFLSGFVRREVREASISAGADTFLLKPCPPDVLSHEVSTLIARLARTRADAARV